MPDNGMELKNRCFHRYFPIFSMISGFHSFVLLLIQFILVASLPSKPSLSRHQGAAVTCAASTLGIDFGTSGVRINVVNDKDEVIFDERMLFKPADAQSKELWTSSMDELMLKLPAHVSASVRAISLCGTSASCMILSSQGQVACPVRMYDYDVLKHCGDAGQRALATIQRSSPSGNAVNAATSTLAKLLSWKYESKLSASDRLAHQADVMISYLLHGSSAPPSSSTASYISDWHNALKLGYDVVKLEYPAWLLELLQQEGIDQHVLPAVVEPGSQVGNIAAELSSRYQIPSSCKIVAGTTDSIAAILPFIATGVSQPGEAVTSLGSTTVLKLISTSMVQDSKRGIYSHRLMGSKSMLWLVGGASNVGCSILRQENFSDAELEDLSQEIDPMLDSPYDYYPLCKPGERFPVNDPNKQPVLEPKPSHEASSRAYRREYLHGLLQGIAAVERQGYQALNELGATPLTKVSQSFCSVCTYVPSITLRNWNR
jgi:D-ribulokinase